MTEIYQTIPYLIGSLAALLCVAGIILSGVSLSGTWLVVVAAALLTALLPSKHPGWSTVVAFGLISALVEGVEFLAGALGVRHHGGSAAAGWAAFFGGLLGLPLGAVLIPVPVAGALLGMLLGAAGLAFGVEYHRLRRAGPALHIAMGAVLARVIVLILKLVATLGMAAWLLARFIGAK